MNNIIVPISNIEYNVERPILFDIVKQVMDITQISSKTRVIIGTDNKVLQMNSDINGKNSIDLNLWPYDERVSIEIIEDYDENELYNNPVRGIEAPLIFNDKNLDVVIRPIYIPSNITINFRYKASDKNKANMWRNGVRNKLSLSNNINLHTVNYSYTIPYELFIILQEIHRLRENIAPYNELYPNYIKSNLDSRASIVSNQDGSKIEYIIAERQNTIQGIFDFNIPDKPEKEGESTTYTTAFSYKIRYSKPVQCNLVYPDVIHNQVLNKKFRQIYNLKEVKSQYSYTQLAMNDFDTINIGKQYYSSRGVNSPDFDFSFLPNTVQSGTNNLLTILVTINPNDKRSLFNLKQLGTHHLSQDLLDFINIERNYVNKPFGSILNISLYENKLLRENLLTIDSDLNISATIDLDLRKVYRVRIALVTNLDNLSGTTITRIRQYNLNHLPFANKLAFAINSILKDGRLHKTKLDKFDLYKLGLLSKQNVNSLNPVSDPLYDPTLIKQYLVENLFIITKG